MSTTPATLWERLVLAERPSISLSAFRIAVAVTVGCHVIPTLLQLPDNYLATAFRTLNPSFFPIGVLRLVQQSPDALVYAMTGFFSLCWFGFLVGYRAQIACIGMTACCYYFYALNALHIGTLSWDILLVTLFLMCVTGYHGDYFSLDSLRLPKANASTVHGTQTTDKSVHSPQSTEHRSNRELSTVDRGRSSIESTPAVGDEEPAYRTRRPFFVQWLLQLQMASTYFYTGLAKITADGNWLTDNPYYYLMHSPSGGVVREFQGRAWLAQQPALCYAIGIGVIVMEFSLSILWFVRRTRLPAIAIGWLFHILLLVTLHVPTIFFFLFPAQMLLFIPPEDVVAWIERRRQRKAGRQGLLVYDGHCMFCVGSVRRLLVLDLFGYLRPVDYQRVEDVATLHPLLTRERCHAQMHLVEPAGRLSGGFGAIRRLSLRLPLLWPLAPLVHLPGAWFAGDPAYRWVARNRYLLHRHHACDDNRCVANP